jgi:hypothetical protein
MVRFAIAFLLAVYVNAQSAEQLLHIGAPVPQSGGYGFIDSSDPVAYSWRPQYLFVDTAYQRSQWYRVAPGPYVAPSTVAPLVHWQSISGDSTDNTFAGPIPIGFSFTYFGKSYDSLYLSSNGYVVFGSYARASGADGTGAATAPTASGFGCMPSAALPHGCAAFLATDNELLRTQNDSSRAFFRTNPTKDTFYLTVYNVYHISNASTAYTVHKFRVDVQVVLTKQDSALTFMYRKFYGVATIGLSAFSAEQVFRAGCIPDGCDQYAVSIGVQNDSATAGSAYMCNGSFTTPGSITNLFAGLAVRFKPFLDVVRADTLVWPPRNYEVMAGDSLVPVAAFRNVHTSSQSFAVALRIRNQRTGATLYESHDSIANLAAGASQRVTFAKWHTSVATDTQIGELLIDSYSSPAAVSGSTDAWPYNDTVRSVMFVMKRLASFWDSENDFSVPLLKAGTYPDMKMWVGPNTTTVDGDVYTWSPPPQRGKQGDPTRMQLNSPVIHFDRLDMNGVEYDHCGYSSGALDESGTGDTLTSFPIDLTRVGGHPVLSFSYQRSGKRSYPRWYDISTVFGPERTVTNPDRSIIYRAGDSLEVLFADTSQVANVTKWHRVWACDGGKDFTFQRVFIPIDSTYLKPNFRFRIRLKGKNDFPNGNPADDNDDWYVDNVSVINPVRPEIEFEFARLGSDWAYEQVPASEAVSVPIQVSVANNGGMLASSFGVAVVVSDPGDRHVPNSVYARLITVPVLTPGTSILISAPGWNARTSGPGTYDISTFMLPKGYDYNLQNDSTYTRITMLFNDSYVYDNGQNAAPGFFQMPGIGLNMQETDRAAPLGGSNFSGTGPGAVATRFTIYQRDSIYGANIWFGAANQAPDSIEIGLYASNGATPGELVQNPCSSFRTTRSGPYDAFSRYRFPCKVIVLDEGDYWMSVSQLGSSGMQLGVTDYKSSVDWTVYDRSPGGQHAFIVNNPSLIGRFAYTTGVAPSNWQAFYRADNIGLPAFGYDIAKTARTVASATCNSSLMAFNGQGSWIPLIRPYFATRPFGPRVDPVELSSFTGRFRGDRVSLAWTTASEINNSGFIVDRRTTSNSEWNTLSALIPGHGTSTDAHEYALDDQHVQSGTIYEYRLRQIDNDGSNTALAAVTVAIPARDFTLLPNAPEPFDYASTLNFTIPSSTIVHAHITDVMGRTIREFIAATATAGENHITWDARTDDGETVPPGAYIVAVTAGQQTLTRVVHVVR